MIEQSDNRQGNGQFILVEHTLLERVIKSYRFSIYIACCIVLLGLTSCFKNTKTPLQGLPEETDTNYSSLATASDDGTNSWLSAILSEYLMNDEFTPPLNTLVVTGSQVITTQAQVDALATANKINGDLILNPSLNLDFSPLSFLQEVTGKFELSGSSFQSTLSGFDCLSTIGGDFSIFLNSGLYRLTSFSALRTVGGDFSISNNASMLSIPSFSMLESIGEFFIISSNDNLRSIPSFPILNFVNGFFSITSNDALTSISGFDQLSNSDISDFISVKNNPSLDCTNPIPPFVPVNFNSGNAVNCP